jgi:hypothetical protein
MGSKTKDYSKEFFDKANELHNYKYDYTNSVYINSRTDITILCKECNTTFNQKPNEHTRVRKTPIRGKFSNANGGCPNCRLKVLSLAQTKNSSDYISKANELHKNIYDYSDTEIDILNTPCYGDKKISITIKCQKHGKVKVSKLQHIDKHNPQVCPSCSRYNQKLIDLLSQKGHTSDLEKLGTEIPTIFYILKFKDFYKYGLTTKSIQLRYKNLKEDYKIIQEIKTDLTTAIELEELLHNYCVINKLKIRPKLLEGNGSTECFTI